MKVFKVQYEHFRCKECGEKLFVPNIYKVLQSQYKHNAVPYGYSAKLQTKCSCSKLNRILCDCHENNNRITVCVHSVDVIPEATQ